MTGDIVGKAKQFHPDEHVPDSEPFGQCPKCGQPLVERFKSFPVHSDSCDFSIWKTIAGRLLSREEFETLLREKQVGPLQGFRSRKGKRFDAVLKLSDDFKTEFDFGQDDADKESARAAVDFTRPGAGGQMSPSAARAYSRTAMSYICENAVGTERTCEFPHRQNHFAAADGTDADGQAARIRQDGFAAEVHLQKRPAVRGLSGFERERQARL